VTERERKLEALGYPLDRCPPSGTIIEPFSIVGNLLFASGQVPFDGDTVVSKGKVPSQVSVDDATRAAGLCAANILRVIRARLGTLDRIERAVRLTGYVNADPDFTDCHLVIHGATNVIRDVLGEAGRHARTALGMGQLPLGVSVEVEMIFEVKA
jgi:enamine deaminase RidA (YjgF/YER057c/UK114 family)